MPPRHVLSPHEKRLMANVYQYFKQESQEGRANGVHTRKRVVQATGVSESTVERIWKAYNEDNTTTYEPVRHLLVITAIISITFGFLYFLLCDVLFTVGNSSDSE